MSLAFLVITASKPLIYPSRLHSSGLILLDHVLLGRIWLGSRLVCCRDLIFFRALSFRRILLGPILLVSICFVVCVFLALPISPSWSHSSEVLIFLGHILPVGSCLVIFCVISRGSGVLSRSRPSFEVVLNM